jgi:hypothetical protein
MFYGAHRRYLNNEGVSVIEPPNGFKSKRQLKQLKLSRERESRGEGVSFQMNFQKRQDEEGEHNVKKFKKVANIVRNTITLDHITNIQKDDWSEELRAGVKIWINRQTGEVTSECPWEVAIAAAATPMQRMLAKQKSLRRQSQGSLMTQNSLLGNEFVLGTGSLVYEGKEVHELFDLLDKAK